MMTIEEWKSTHPTGAIQYEQPIEWFKGNVKCCYNCCYWDKDISLLGDYAVNGCSSHSYHMTRWDHFCDDWNGERGKQDNLLDFVKRNWNDADKENNK